MQQLNIQNEKPNPILNHLTATKKTAAIMQVTAYKYNFLCKHIIKGGFRMVEAVKRGYELFTKRVFLLLKQGRHA